MSMPATALSPHIEPHLSHGARLVSVDGRELPLRAVALEVEAAAGIARVVLTQRFHNPYAGPLAVSYELPLPAEGAVSGFAFTLAGRRIVGEIDKKGRARARFEEAVLAGKSAALLEQDRASLFRQEIGNVPPGSDIVAEISVDQKLRWLAEGEWEWRFPTVVAPRFLGAEGRVADAERVTVDVADGPLARTTSLALVIGDALSRASAPERAGERVSHTAVVAPEARVASPSHALAVAARQGAWHVSFAEERGARLDRDVVVRWPVATPAVGAGLVCARPARDRAPSSQAYGLVTLTPPSAGAAHAGVPRDLTLLIDASGSMHGEPLEQVRRVALALIATLDAGDSLELIAFANQPRHFMPGPERATPARKREAEAWLRALRAEGGTEMREGILGALAPLRRDAQRQVVLFTDGLIGFEEEIVRAILERLPEGSRVHTVGVGSAVNRTLTLGAARAGRGIEAIIGLGEDPERAALRLCAHTAAPLVVDLEITGSALVAHHPAALPDLYAGAPALVSLALQPGGGELEVRGRTADGPFEQRIAVPPLEPGEGAAAIVALYGREAVADLELRAAAGERGVDRAIEALGLDFQLATRMTSWLAVSAAPTVDPRDPTRREVMPHELPHGMSAEGLGLRAPSLGRVGARPAAAMPMKVASLPLGAPAPAHAAASRGFGGAPFDDALAAPEPLEELEADAAAEVFEEFEEARATGAPRAPVPKAPSPPQPVEQKRARSLLGRAADKLRDALKSKAPAALALRGRVLVSSALRFVVELALSCELEWAPTAVVVVLADGTRVAADVLLDVTTRAGKLAAGMTVRLALEAPPGRADWIVAPVAIELTSAGRAVVVTL